MNTSQLKLSLIQQIVQLNDEQSLMKVQEFIKKLIPLEDSVDHSFLNNNRTDSHNSRENFSEYIKEWIKEM
ncbi:hypothetical protein [Namhaeicola litoreus]|uniref:Addiction module component n=1 Tax=Namhaeicola litoreus TaxID=1052145 RepID=A0ABW3XZA0_9FLAO